MIHAPCTMQTLIRTSKHLKSISKSSCILGEFSKKKDKKFNLTETLSASSSILVFYLGGAAGHLCLVLSASHSFLDFGEAVGFHPFFASYFHFT